MLGVIGLGLGLIVAFFAGAGADHVVENGLTVDVPAMVSK